MAYMGFQNMLMMTVSWNQMNSYLTILPNLTQLSDDAFLDSKFETFDFHDFYLVYGKPGGNLGLILLP